MSFNAECPFCRMLVRNVPDGHAGNSLECPRCHSPFTLMAGAGQAVKTPAAPEEAVSETAAPAKPGDYFEFAGRKAAQAKGATPPPAAAKPRAPAPHRASRSLRLPPEAQGITSCFLAGLGIMLAAVFHQAILLFLVSGLALVVGAVGLLSAYKKRCEPLFPGIGLAASVATMVLALMYPGWLTSPNHGVKEDTGKALRGPGFRGQPGPGAAPAKPQS